jgi:CDP-diacylglycerol--glycerol-3-phosphate 3-phosphatidyltransferase
VNEIVEPRDFKNLHKTGLRHGSSFAIGRWFCSARDAVARLLVAIGVTPNMVTWFGVLATAGAGACFLVQGGESWSEARSAGRLPWPVMGALMLLVAGACDMLDGAVARIGRLGSPLGEVLDSALDRLSDLLIYLALAAHFAWKGNTTYVALAVLALSHAMLISYLKARAENLIPRCSVGYWQRGERFAALLIAAFSAHLPAVLWQQALSPAFTVLRRWRWTHDVLASQQGHGQPPREGPFDDWRRWLTPWRFPRGSIPYDLVTGANIAFIIVAPWLSSFFTADSDPLRRWLDLIVR